MDLIRRKPRLQLLPILVGILLVTLNGCRKNSEANVDGEREEGVQLARIVGASMAPHLLGTHALLSCENCNHGFAIDALSLPRDRTAVCPNCGFAEVEIDETHLVEAQQVEVVELPEASPLPKRWSLVAFRHPVEKDALAVKRLLGFPGESIRIEFGDVFVDGQRLRKDFADQWAMRINVHHDDSYESRLQKMSDEIDVLQVGDDLSPIWTRQRWYSPGQSWRREGEVWKTNVAGVDNSDVSGQKQSRRLLVYRHYRCAPSVRPNRSAVAIDDNYGYNQSLARDLNPCSDLMISGLLKMAKGAALRVSINNGHAWFALEFDSSTSSGRIFEVHQDSTTLDSSVAQELLGEFSIGPGAFGNFEEFALSTFDRQVTVAIGREEVFRKPWARKSDQEQAHHVSEPIRIEASGALSEVRELLVDRDIYYLSPTQSHRPWIAERDETSELFLLGDNVPLSLDSRQWRQDAIKREDLLGTVRARRIAKQ